MIIFYALLLRITFHSLQTIDSVLLLLLLLLTVQDPARFVFHPVAPSPNPNPNQHKHQQTFPFLQKTRRPLVESENGTPSRCE